MGWYSAIILKTVLCLHLQAFENLKVKKKTSDWLNHMV